MNGMYTLWGVQTHLVHLGYGYKQRKHRCSMRYPFHSQLDPQLNLINREKRSRNTFTAVFVALYRHGTCMCRVTELMATNWVSHQCVVLTQYTSMERSVMALWKRLCFSWISPKATSFYWSGSLLIYHQCQARAGPTVLFGLCGDLLRRVVRNVLGWYCILTCNNVWKDEGVGDDPTWPSFERICPSG